MKTKILRVVSQGDVTYIPSSKEVNGQLAKCDVVCNDMVKLHQ